MEHAYLDCVGAYVVEYRAYLACHEVDGYGVDACHTYGVFVDYRDNGRGSVAAAGCECFEVGLQASASAGVAACDSEGATICFLVHIFHFSRFHALSQNSHSIFVHSTKISVMAALVSGEAACASSSQMAIARWVDASNAGSA